MRHLFPRRLNDTQLERRHNEEFYQKVYKFIRTTYQFGNLSYEVLLDHFKFELTFLDILARVVL